MSVPLTTKDIIREAGPMAALIRDLVYDDHEAGDYTTFASISDVLGVSVEWVARLCKKLRDMGVVAIEGQTTSQGKTLPSLVSPVLSFTPKQSTSPEFTPEFTPELTEKGGFAPPSSLPFSSLSDSLSSSPPIILPTSPKEKAPISREDHPGFDEFWKAYPVKKEKPRAFKAWNKYKPDLVTVLAAIEAQRKEKELKVRAMGWAPDWKHPTTWLNSGCWGDEVVDVEVRADGKKGPPGPPPYSNSKWNYENQCWVQR